MLPARQSDRRAARLRLDQQVSIARSYAWQAVDSIGAGNHGDPADGNVDRAIGLSRGGKIGQPGEILQSLFTLVHQLNSTAAGRLGLDESAGSEWQ